MSPSYCWAFCFERFHSVIQIHSKTTNADCYQQFLALTLLASYLHLYPWCGRVSLYSTPIIIILYSKTLDTINLKKWQSYIIILAFFISFGEYTPKFLTNYFQENFYITYSSKSLIKTLKNKYNPNTNVILCNEASGSSFWLKLFVLFCISKT